MFRRMSRKGGGGMQMQGNESDSQDGDSVELMTDEVVTVDLVSPAADGEMTGG